MNLTHLVDRLVEAIERNPELDDDALEGMLLDHGADVRTARELLLFVPIAWCRALFQHAGPTFPRTFGLFQNGALAPERALADEPAFVEGLLAAKRCKKRDLFFSVAGRSADFNAINQALHGGSKLKDLELGVTVVLEGSFLDDALAHSAPTQAKPWWKFWLSAPPPVEDRVALGATRSWETASSGLMVELEPESRMLSGWLREALAQHRADTTQPEAELSCEAMVFTSHPHPSRANLQLDFRFQSARLPGRPLIESLGGLGASVEAAMRNGFDKFLRAVLHPLLTVLVDEKHAGGQVEWDTIARNGDPWRVCMGPTLQMNSPSPAIDTNVFINRLLHAWTAAAATREIHWIRWFVMVDRDGRAGSEVLLDNEPWSEGQTILDAWQLPATDNVYSLRHFLFVIPPQ